MKKEGTMVAIFLDVEGQHLYARVRGRQDRTMQTGPAFMLI